MWKGYRTLKTIKTSTIYKINEVNQAIIPIHISTRDTGVFPPYATENNLALDNKFSGYISDNTNSVSLNYDVLFDIEIASKEAYLEEKFKKAVQQHYFKKIIVENHNFKKNGWTTIWMVFTGIAIFSLAIAFKLLLDESQYFIFLEMLDLMGWVFIWRATDPFFIERKIMRIHQAIAYRIMHSEIRFHYLLGTEVTKDV